MEVRHYEALASSQRESGNEATQNDEIKQISCTQLQPVTVMMYFVA